MVGIDQLVTVQFMSSKSHDAPKTRISHKDYLLSYFSIVFFDGSFELDKAIISVTTPGYHCLF